MNRIIAWHDQARRMLASGAYPSKAAIARELGKSAGQVYEVLNPGAGIRAKGQRLNRQRRLYRTDPEYRARMIAQARAYAGTNPAKTRTPSAGKYPLHIRCDDSFLAILDAWIERQPEPVTRSEAVRRIVRTAVAPPPALGGPQP